MLGVVKRKERAYSTYVGLHSQEPGAVRASLGLHYDGEGARDSLTG